MANATERLRMKKAELSIGPGKMLLSVTLLSQFKCVWRGRREHDIGRGVIGFS